MSPMSIIPSSTFFATIGGRVHPSCVHLKFAYKRKTREACLWSPSYFSIIKTRVRKNRRLCSPEVREYVGIWECWCRWRWRLWRRGICKYIMANECRCTWRDSGSPIVKHRKLQRWRENNEIRVSSSSDEDCATPRHAVYDDVSFVSENYNPIA